jgi:hypothetical protein
MRTGQAAPRAALPVDSTDASACEQWEARRMPDTTSPAPPRPADRVRPRAPVRVSDELQGWLEGDGQKTIGGLIEVFGKRAFALIFVMLMGVPALPLPTGGATHVFEVIAVLLAGQLVVGRDEIWLPRRWRARTVDTEGRFIRVLLRTIRRVERLSKQRLSFVFGHRLSTLVFGVLVAVGATAAFLAPPFTGLDTLPALGVVLISLGVLLEDFVFVALGVVVAAGGVLLEIVVGSAALKGLTGLF